MDGGKFTWSESYRIGDALIDGQHRRLVELAGLFSEAVEHGKGAQVAAQAMLALRTYCREHFREEEEHFRAKGRSMELQLALHHDMHDQLVEELDSISRSLDQGRGEDARKVLEWWIEHRLVAHFLKVDLHMVRLVGA